MAEIVDTEEIEQDGLAAALEDRGAPATPLKTLEIALDDIAELENGRTSYDGIDELAQMLHAEGLLHALTVRPAPPEATHGKPYELICGYRRKRAAQRLRDEQLARGGATAWTHVLCHVRAVDDADVKFANLIENIGRDDLTALEVAQAISQLKEDGYKQVEIARKLGMSASEISKRLTLLRQPESVIARLQQGQLSPSHVERLFALDEDEEKEEMARRAVKFKWSEQELGDRVREFRQVKATDATATASAADEDEPPIESVVVSARVEVPSLRLRDDLTADDDNRIVLWLLLRCANDYALLEQLEVQFGFSYEELWDYIRTLNDEEVRELIVLIGRRGVTSPHRYFDLERSLRDDLGQPRSYERRRPRFEEEQLPLPGKVVLEDLLIDDMERED